MKKLKDIVMRVVHMKYKKYIIVTAVGVVVVGFVGENSIVAHLRNKHKIAELTETLAEYTEENQRYQNRISELLNTPKAMERVAREMHFMKAADEDIFTLSDDENKTTPDDETVE